MDGTFTAREVRDHASADDYTGAWRKVLRAFADRLEADEKAVPAAWMRDSGVDIESEAACVTNTVRNLWLASNPKRIERYTIPLYTHPAPSDESAQTNDDAEQLRACREDWQKVCDVIHPGWHFNPEEIVEKLKAPSDAEKRETMTPRELAKRIERGEKWKLADEPAPCQSQNAERLAKALRRTCRKMKTFSRTGALDGAVAVWVDEIEAALAAQENPNG